MTKFKIAMLGCSFALAMIFVNRAFSQEEVVPTIPEMDLEGTVHNLTVGKSDGVAIRLRHTTNGPIITGVFDCNQLYGSFALNGQVLKNAQRRTISMCFEGKLNLGNDGSNWETGTTFPFTITLFLDGGTIKGVYFIGKNGNKVEATIPQMGTLQLKRRK